MASVAVSWAWLPFSEYKSVMAYYQKVMQPGEVIHSIGQLSWTIYLPAVFSFIFAAVLYALSASLLPLHVRPIAPVLGGVLLLAAILILVRIWLRQWSTEMVVTDRRVIYKIGLIRRHTVEMNISKIETVDVEQDILGRIFGYGTVLIRGTGAGFEPLQQVADPLALRNAILVG